MEVLMANHTKHIPWYLWPFAALWRLITTIVEMTGRFVAMILGLVFILVGGVVSLTIVGAIVGIPLAIVGILLFLRGIF
jgi:phage-related protein